MKILKHKDSKDGLYCLYQKESPEIITGWGILMNYSVARVYPLPPPERRGLSPTCINLFLSVLNLTEPLALLELCVNVYTFVFLSYVQLHTLSLPSNFAVPSLKTTNSLEDDPLTSHFPTMSYFSFDAQAEKKMQEKIRRIKTRIKLFFIINLSAFYLPQSAEKVNRQRSEVKWK